jgi:hypothetical protein
VWLLVLSTRIGQHDPGFLFAVLPFVAVAVGMAGLVLTLGSGMLVLRLLTNADGARLQTTALGACLLVMGLLGLGMEPWVGLLLLLHGAALVALMLSPGAERDLGPWRRGLTQPAPWGSRPGTGIWSDEPPQQGPWSPDPRTLPLMSWKGHSGPRPPWWVTWQTALRQGIPLWEAVVLGVALGGWLLGLVLVLADFAHHRVSLPGAGLVLAAFGTVWLVERRVRTRLARPS